MLSRSIQFHVLLVCLLGPMLLSAQERARPVVTDELWTSLSVSGRPPKFFNDLIGKQIRKRIQLAGELGYRSGDIFFAGRQVYLDGSIRYEVSDLLRIGVEQRYSMRPDWEDRTRTQFKVYLRKEFGRAELNYRFIYQHSYREFGSQRELFRNRLLLEYNIPKWKLDPIVATEIFTWANPQGLSYVGTRYKLGTSWSPWKGHTITFFYVHDRERDVAWPDHRYIYSFDYGINITKLDRRKKTEPAP